MSSEQGQYVKYDFYKVDPLWRRLAPQERAEAREEFIATLDEFSSALETRSYSLVGVRGDCDLLLWKIGNSLEVHQALAGQLNRTRLGAYLSLPYSFLALTRRSQYVGRHRHPGQEGTRLTLQPQEAPYLIVYPFVKTRDWYQLPVEERQQMMNQHFAVGHKYPSVKINTSYSFGLDDQEFIVAFTTDKLEDFLNLVMELRETPASRYTLRDTPIFTCVAKGVREALEDLGI